MSHALLRLLALLALLGSAPLAAQEAVVRGDDRSRAVALVREILARRTYLLLDRDTVLPAAFHSTGDVVVYDADVRLEGRIDGAVAVIGGHFFIRPGSRVAGPIAVVGGEAYTSKLATVGEIVEAEPGTLLVLDGDSAVAVPGSRPGALAATIIPPPEAPRFGFALVPTPTYNRVDGLTVGGGARMRLDRRRENGGTATAWVSYRAARRAPGGGVRVDMPLVRELRATGEISRATRTNDAWIRGDVFNSAAAAVLGDDYRDYYESDVAQLFVHRPLAFPLISGETWLAPRLGVRLSRDRSLEARGPWALTGREGLERVNPAIDEGTLISVVAGTEVHLAGRTSAFRGDASAEQGVSGTDGIGTFTQLRADGFWTATALRRQAAEVYFRFMVPLGDAPQQRRGILGGTGTLPTLDIGDYRGDHLAFIETSYLFPLPTPPVKYLGTPKFELTYMTGAAWSGTESPPWTQNVGVGIRFPFIRVRAVVDPAASSLRPILDFGLTVPARAPAAAL